MLYKQISNLISNLSEKNKLGNEIKDAVNIRRSSSVTLPHGRHTYGVANGIVATLKALKEGENPRVTQRSLKCLQV